MKFRDQGAIVFRIATPSLSGITEKAVPSIRVGVSSYNFQSYVREKIRQVFQESQFANWDDEGARAVGLAALVAAEKLVDTLPPLSAKPAVFAMKSGKLSFQWMGQGPVKDALIVSVDGDGGVSFATSCANGKKISGSEIFSGSPPSDVTECVLHSFVEPALQPTAAGT